MRRRMEQVRLMAKFRVMVDKVGKKPRGLGLIGFR
jgi:hypothetical protein